MRKYQFFVKFPGTGDYGTDWKFVAENRVPWDDAQRYARSIAALHRQNVRVFMVKGKTLGLLVSEFSP